MFRFILILVLLSVLQSSLSQELYICEAGDSNLIGVFEKTDEVIDDAPVFTNENELSFFRNKGFWYLGNLGPWPPETHYRCVELEGCNVGLKIPPTSEQGDWKPTKQYGKEPLPKISLTPCQQPDQEL